MSVSFSLNKIVFYVLSYKLTSSLHCPGDGMLLNERATQEPLALQMSTVMIPSSS